MRIALLLVLTLIYFLSALFDFDCYLKYKLRFALKDSYAT